MKEKCFAYQNKKTQEWLKIYSRYYFHPHKHVIEAVERFDTFDRSVIYSARNIIEEDFSKAKLEDREDWRLIEVEIEYNFTRAK
jgi:hypothetical protein